MNCSRKISVHIGQAFKQKKSRGEWIGVCDAADPDHQASDSAHGNILATRDSRFGIPENPQNPRWFRNTSYAHFSCPVSFMYDRGCIHVGNITNPDHIKKLQEELFHRRCPKSHILGYPLVIRNEAGAEEAVGGEGEEKDWWKMLLSKDITGSRMVLLPPEPMTSCQ